jgi:hypothetical protein
MDCRMTARKDWVLGNNGCYCEVMRSSRVSLLQMSGLVVVVEVAREVQQLLHWYSTAYPCPRPCQAVVVQSRMDLIDTMLAFGDDYRNGWMRIVDLSHT